MTSMNSERDQRPRKSRIVRFAVPVLFFLVAVIVVIEWLVTIGIRAHKQHIAVEAIEALKGVVTYDYLVDFYDSRLALGYDHPEFKKIENILDQFPQADRDPDGRAWLRGLLGPDLFHDVVRINLAYFYDESGKHNDNPNSIEPALPYLGTFPRLRVLLLSRHLAADDALRAVSDLKEIEKIYLWDAQVTDAGVECLHGMPKLRYLHLSNSKITDRSLEILGNMPSLEGLSMQFNHFTDRGLSHLAGLKKLTSLWVCSPGQDESPDRISDAGLVYLKGLANLEELGIQNTLVTDAGLEHLKGLSRLKAIFLEGSQVTKVGMNKFMTAMPGVRVSGK